MGNFGEEVFSSSEGNNNKFSRKELTIKMIQLECWAEQLSTASALGTFQNEEGGNPLSTCKAIEKYFYERLSGIVRRKLVAAQTERSDQDLDDIVGSQNVEASKSSSSSSAPQIPVLRSRKSSEMNMIASPEELHSRLLKAKNQCAVLKADLLLNFRKYRC